MHFDEKFWIAVAFVLFASLVYKKLTTLISSALDKKLDGIKSELTKAEQLKEEAQNIFTNYQKEQKNAESHAQDIIAQAKKSSEELLKKSKAEIKKNTKNKIAEIEENLATRRTIFTNGLRKEIADTALDIVQDYLEKNKSSISEQSYSESIASLKQTKQS